MIDDVFRKISQENLSDWGVVLLGVTGVPGIAGRLSGAAVKEFASMALERLALDDPVLDLVVDLASTGETSPAHLRDSLATLCEAKHIDLQKSRLTWRLCSLQHILGTLGPDPVYGMIALSEFWSAWDWPADAPSSMQTDGVVTPEDYHACSHYRHVLNDHYNWLQNRNAQLDGKNCRS